MGAALLLARPLRGQKHDKEKKGVCDSSRVSGWHLSYGGGRQALTNQVGEAAGYLKSATASGGFFLLDGVERWPR
jgi:hypothetical protein